MRRPHDIRSLMRQVGSHAGFIALGVVFGGGAFLALDLLNPPAARTALLGGPSYQTCRDALQDGHASIRRGELGYRAGLDADNDGLACEPFAPR